MTINEIKKLTPHEFAERYPFLQLRKWDPETRTYSLGFWSEKDGNIRHNIGDPIMMFYKDDFHGWNSLILCWAEKVREVFINNGDGKIPNDIFLTDIKEKYGSLRISFNYGFKAPYEKINELTSMAEHLSYYWCYCCGHIGRTSNEKKLASYCSKGYWISYQCKKCAKKKSWQNIKEYGIEPEYYKKWLHSNPHFNMYKDIFDQDYERYEGDWFVRHTKGQGENKTNYVYDCHELIEGMF